MAEGINSTEDILKALNSAGSYFQALERRVQDLEEKIGRLAGGTMSGHTNSVSTPPQDEQARSATEKYEPQQPVQNTVEDKKNCLYFANGADGVFLKSSGSPDFLDRISLYCFEKVNESEARVSVVDKLSVVRKFSSNPDALESFCEQLNLCSENSRGIETVERGTAVLEGDKWRITTKVKIRYY